jgi:hypothetical protein
MLSRNGCGPTAGLSNLLNGNQAVRVVLRPSPFFESALTFNSNGGYDYLLRASGRHIQAGVC